MLYLRQMVDFSAFLKDPLARANEDRALQQDYRNSRLKDKFYFLLLQGFFLDNLRSPM